MKTCSVCESPHIAKGYCKKHYQQFRKHGRTLPDLSVEDRFWSKVDRRGADDCWPWNAAVNTSGYGVFQLSRTARRAHRIAYEMLVGAIPDGLTIDHLCRQIRCCNPAHMEPVPVAENSRRGNVVRRPSHCPSGHAYTEANTRLGSDGRRRCIECHRRRCREHYNNTKAGQTTRR